MQQHTVRRLGTIMGIWAHPDDETYLSGGLMATARAAGQRVVCVTATRGERGGGPEVDPDALARTRERELATALFVLGVHERHQLDHPDGGCDAVDEAEAVDAMSALVERVSPDTIVTFGPDGMTGHPDHRAVHRWATGAWRATGRGARLLYATTAPGFARRHAAVHEALDPFEPGLPSSTPLSELSVRLVLDEATLDTKLRALRSHVSQVTPVERIIGSDALARWWAEECFADAEAGLARAVGAGRGVGVAAVPAGSGS